MFSTRVLYFFAAVLFSSSKFSEGTEFNDNLYKLANVIDKAFDLQTIRPVSDTNSTLNVNVDWHLVGIVQFDETNGYLEASGYFTFSWTSNVYHGNTLAVVGSSLILTRWIWKPPVVLLNSVEQSDEIGSGGHVKIAYDFINDTCVWKPWHVSKIGCTPNVKFYPFDKQTCTFKLAVWGYTNAQVTLVPNNNAWTMEFFEKNGKWNIDETSTEATVLNGISVINYKVQLSRRPWYYVINLIVPAMLLTTLNACSFLAPAESGKRIIFSVICSLSYVVLFNIILSFMPTSASPMAILSYFTLVMMIFNMGISVSTIILQRIHFHQKPNDMCKCYNRYPSRNAVRKVSPATDSATWDDPKQTEDTFKVEQVSQNAKNAELSREETW